MNTQHPAYFIWRFRSLIIVGVLVITLASATAAYLTPAQYDTSISFSINRINKQETPYYQYDGYYAIQASDLFSQTVLSWFLTPSVLLEIYSKAGVDAQVKSINTLTSRFKAKKYSAQNIVVTFTERDQDSAQKISQALISTIQDKAKVANQTADQKALFEIVGATPVIIQSKPSVMLIGAIGLVAGLLIMTVLAYLLSFVKSNRPVPPQHTGSFHS